MKRNKRRFIFFFADFVELFKWTKTMKVKGVRVFFIVTLTSALISSSVNFSCWRDSKNFVNVARVITCDFEVSTPEQLLTILAAATASKTCFFWRLLLVLYSRQSMELFLVKRPVSITHFRLTKIETNDLFVKLNHSSILFETTNACLTVRNI